MKNTPRRYIGIEEIEQKTTLTKGDVLHAIEKNQLVLMASIDAQYMAALFDKKTVGAVFDYQGIVLLGNDTARKFAVTQKSQTVSLLGVVELDKIRNWRSARSALGPFDCSELDCCTEKMKLPDVMFKALAKVEKGFTSTQLNRNFKEMLSNLASTNEKNSENSNNGLSSLDLKQYLKSVPIEIEPHSFRVDLLLIAEMFGQDCIRPHETLKQPQVVPEINSAQLLTHPIEQIVYRVLIANSSLNADKIWVLIRKDVNQEGQRTYDIDNVIDTMTADSVSWFGKGDSLDNEMSYDSFRKSTVYRVKKKIKGN